VTTHLRGYVDNHINEIIPQVADQMCHAIATGDVICVEEDEDSDADFVVVRVEVRVVHETVVPRKFVPKLQLEGRFC
jgi:hypothetical protein